MEEPRFGLIPWTVYHDSIIMMFMMPSDPKFGGSNYQIAKGRKESGETDLEAAIREASEELGLKPSNIESINKESLFTSGGNYNLTVYAAKIKEFTDFDKPHFETGKVIWMTNREFTRAGRADQRNAVNAIHNLIKKSLESTG